MGQREFRWELSEEDRRRAFEARNRPLRAKDVVRAHVSQPRLVPRTIRSMLVGAKQGVMNDQGLVWSLHQERIRRAVPDAAFGVDWHPVDEFVGFLREHASGANRALEIGAGAGRVARAVAPHVKELVCTDISEVALREAQCALREHSHVSFVQTSGYRLGPVEDDSVDLVYSHDVFLTFDSNEALALLDEAARVLRPGGLLVLGIDTIDDPAVAKGHLETVRRSARANRFSATLMRPWTEAQIEKLCEVAGLEVSGQGHGTPRGGSRRAPYFLAARAS